MSLLKQRITEDMKTAMRQKDSARLGAIRLLLAAIKQREVDERIELGDGDIHAIVEKELKKRRDSISQYESANRQDLADIEKFEVGVLSAYMPEQLSEDEILAVIEAALANHGTAPGAMGKIIGEVRPKLAGRADMAKVSALVKSRLG